jgi:hypothetical protein
MSNAKRRFKIFDGMTWPTVDAELAWRLVHAQQHVTSADLLYLSSVLSAYEELISCGRAKRERVCRELRKERNEYTN